MSSRCEARTAKGMQCSRHVTGDNSLCKIHQKQSERPEVIDRYTIEILEKRIESHRDYVNQTICIRESTGLPIRFPNMPEDISENFVKFGIRARGDKTSKWAKAVSTKQHKYSGDLTSDVEGTQEVKCFTSDGPPSFGPTEKWDVIYFLDARNWLNDSWILWRCSLSNTSDDWKNIKLNKTETTQDKNEQGQRPRFTWDALYPQIQKYCSKVFEGSFNDIKQNQQEVESTDSQ